MTGRKNPPLEFAPVPEGAPITFDLLAQAYLEDYVLQRYKALTTARARIEHLRQTFGGRLALTINANDVRSYQLHRRKEGAEAATINRETSILSRMFQIALRRGQLDRIDRKSTRLNSSH